MSNQKTTFQQDEIDALVKDIKEQLFSPLFQEAEKELAKAEVSKGKDVSSIGKQSGELNSGNATEPQGAKAMKAEVPVAKAGEEPEASPQAKEASAEASAPGEAPESAPAESASPEAAPQGDPAAEAGAGDPSGGQDLVAAYSQLDDASLQAHWQALKQVLMTKMGAGQDAAQAAPPPAAPPAPEASMSAPPAPPAGPPPGAGAPMMRSERVEEDLKKAEQRVETLEKQFVQLLEKLLKPERKAVTSMVEYVAKTEPEKKEAPVLTKDQVKAKLQKASRNPQLKKSDGDLIVRYFLNQDVKLEELDHLLKD